MGQQASIVNDIFIDKNGARPLTIYRAKEFAFRTRNKKSKAMLEWWICKEEIKNGKIKSGNFNN